MAVAVIAAAKEKGRRNMIRSEKLEEGWVEEAQDVDSGHLCLCPVFLTW